MGNAIASACRTVYRSVVAPVFRAVSSFVAPIVKAVSAVVTPIIKVATKVVETVSSVIEKGKELVSKGINYLANQTWIGRKIKQGYDYVMNETFIGKGIKMVGNAIQKTSDAFFKETWVGQRLTQAKQWFDSTAVGQFVNKAAPVISLAATCLGGVGGVIGSTVNTASKVINVIRNPTQLLKIPFVSNTLNKVKQVRQAGFMKTCSSIYNKTKQYIGVARDPTKLLNNTFVNNTINKVKQTDTYKKFSGLYDKGNQIYKKHVQPKVQKVTTFAKQSASKIVNSSTYKAAQKFVQKNTPSFVYQLTEKTKKSAEYVAKKADQFISPHTQRFKNTQIGSKTVKTLDFANKNVVTPVKAAFSSTFGRFGSFISDKIKKTETYGKYVTSNIQKVKDLYQKGRKQSTNTELDKKQAQIASNKVVTKSLNEVYIEPLNDERLNVANIKPQEEVNNKVPDIVNNKLELKVQVQNVKPKEVANQPQSEAANEPQIEAVNEPESEIDDQSGSNDDDQSGSEGENDINPESQISENVKQLLGEATRMFENKQPQIKQNGVNSEPMMASYILKYGSDSLSQGLQKASNVFKPIQQQNREIPSLNQALVQSKVEFKSVQFISGQQEKGYSIEGKLNLENKTQQQIRFQIDSGQLFGCSKYDTSQHVVVRKLVGELQPREEKQFILQGFCADLGLKWPMNDSNYSLTSYAISNFKEDMGQHEVWQQTG